MSRYQSRKRKGGRIVFVGIAIVVLIIAIGVAGKWFYSANFGDMKNAEQGSGVEKISESPQGKTPEEGKLAKQPLQSGTPQYLGKIIAMPANADVNQTYDIVIENGRVIDPETATDQENMNLGIIGNKVAAVTKEKLKGKKVIDATGLVVAPGFIDNLSYDPNPLGVWNKIADGVTTNNAMHGGTSTPIVWYDHYERDKPPLNFGASFFYTQARNTLKIGRYDGATPEQTKKMVAMAEKALNNGALGISFSLEYVPGITPDEVIPLMNLAYEYNVPVYFHGRYSDMEEPGTNVDTMNELIGYARSSGAAVHVDHINSTGGTFMMKESLGMMDKAIAEGLDMTACTYPYDYWGTYLNSARFDEGWQERFRIGYEDLQIAGTTERLTKESFAKYRKQGKLAVAYAIPKQDIVDSFNAPYVMIGSDAILEPGINNHPRASGTFARTIGLYVREQNVMSLSDAIAKLSLLPAQRLEKQVPAMKNKGRLSPGSDADIVVFDYKTISDRSTVERPDLPSAGIEYVLVGGQVVKDPNGLNRKVRVGKAIKSEFVRVERTSASVDWKELAIPTVEYRGQNYFDIKWLQQKGYQLTWDKLDRTFTITSGADGNQAAAKPSSAPVGELILERGFSIIHGEQTAELLSIGKEAYAPVSLLQSLS